MGRGALMRRGLLMLAAVIALGLAVGAALIWNTRRSLPFNAEGRYFDPETAIVIQEQSVIAYATLTVALGLIGVALGFMARRP
ncbi:MAG: hypothetical protein NWP98_04665 [Erythrobacter sp.]|nr:hypothetical protein [Erythrobacter sp.]